MIAKMLVLWCSLAAAAAAPVFVFAPVAAARVPLAAPYAPPAAPYAPPAAPYAPAHAPALSPYAHAQAAPATRAESAEPNRAYSFVYGVADPATGDLKNAAETRRRGGVRGAYSLLEPDGRVRRVSYTADAAHGFRAAVEWIGAAAHAGQVAVARAPHDALPAPVAAAAPGAPLALPGIAHP